MTWHPSVSYFSRGPASEPSVRKDWGLFRFTLVGPRRSPTNLALSFSSAGIKYDTHSPRQQVYSKVTQIASIQFSLALTGRASHANSIMSDETKKTRSPSAPKIPLQQALVSVELLNKKAGRSPLSRLSAAGALGFAGLTGSSLTLLGALNQYGLIDSSDGQVKVSALALRILHPLNTEDKASAISLSALTPDVFKEIYENHRDLAEDVLANQLIHKGFAHDVSKRVASAYHANLDFANLRDGVVPTISPAKAVQSPTSKADAPTFHKDPVAELYPESSGPELLATFKVPLGLCEVEIKFTGDLLMPDDFDALAEYVGIFKKQYVRKQTAANAARETAKIAAVAPSPAAPAMGEAGLSDEAKKLLG